MSEYTKDIYNFIDNNMTEDESEAFVIKLNNNRELKEEFLMIQNLNEHMKGKLLSGNFENDEDLKQIEKEAKDDISNFILGGKTDKDVLNLLSKAYPEDKTNKGYSFKTVDKKFNDKKLKGRKKLYLWTSSVAAILILIFLLNYFFNNIPQGEKIFTEFHEKPLQLNGIQMRDVEQDVNIAFEEASALYKQNLFDEAYIKFNNLVTNDSTFVQALFYCGLAQFEAGNYKESTQIFINLISTFDEYDIESKWFISLAYIKANEFNTAIPYLKEITQQKSLFQEDAKQILNKIKP